MKTKNITLIDLMTEKKKIVSDNVFISGTELNTVKKLRKLGWNVSEILQGGDSVILTIQSNGRRETREFEDKTVEKVLIKGLRDVEKIK